MAWIPHHACPVVTGSLVEWWQTHMHTLILLFPPTSHDVNFVGGDQKINPRTFWLWNPQIRQPAWEQEITQWDMNPVFLIWMVLASIFIYLLIFSIAHPCRGHPYCICCPGTSIQNLFPTQLGPRNLQRVSSEKHTHRSHFPPLHRLARPLHRSITSCNVWGASILIKHGLEPKSITI